MEIGDILNRDEGIRLKPYLDCCGKYWKECTCQVKGNLTIGVGTNIDQGISQDEAFYLRDGRILVARQEAFKYPFFQTLDPVRQDVVVCMIFNMGSGSFSEFKKMISELDRKDFNSAASEMLNSKWHAQVGDRADRLAEMMRSGVVAP